MVFYNRWNECESLSSHIFGSFHLKIFSLLPLMHSENSNSISYSLQEGRFLQDETSTDPGAENNPSGHY